MLKIILHNAYVLYFEKTKNGFRKTWKPLGTILAKDHIT